MLGLIAQKTSARFNQQITKARAGLASWCSALTGRSRRLLDLTAVQDTCTLLDYRYVGKQMVAISQIRGSASKGRSHDFDANFRPLNPHNEARWQSVYGARQRGLKLSPVMLIQVGRVYFVEDGHHRISVAKARGEQTVEAKVSIWQVAGGLPWKKPAIASA